MTRQTSIDVYEEIKASGLLGRRQLEVYGMIVQHGPITQGEAVQRLHQQTAGRPDHSYTPRFAELLSKGVIAEDCVRVCAVTGRKVIAWRSTAMFPHRNTDPLRKRLQKQLDTYRHKIALLQRRLRRLDAEDEAHGETNQMQLFPVA